MPHSMTPAKMAECISACNACADSCNETLTHCLEKGGKHADLKHISNLIDCAQICSTSADFVGRMSNAHAQVCGVCADVCRTCEASCRAMGDDETMQRCADACASCAKSCEKMAE